MHLRPLSFLLAILLAATPLRAQWVAGLSAGGTDYEALAADVGTRSAMLGLRYDGWPWLYALGGVPLDSAGLPWLAGGAGTRLTAPAGLLEIGADLGFHGHAYRERVLDATGAGLVLEALPWVAVTAGGARLEARTGVLSYTTHFADSTATRALVDAGARLSFAAAPRVAVSGEARYARAEEGGYPFAGVAVAYSAEGIRGWVSGGRWLADAIDRPSWHAGLSLPVGARVELYAEVEQSATDPLYWNLPQRGWRIGLSRSLGGGVAAATEPLPTPLLPDARDGRVAFRLPLDASDTAPALAGDFTGWEPVPMARTAEGWELELPVPPGVHHYAFRRADGTWFVPDALPTVDDGMGGESAILVVS